MTPRAAIVIPARHASSRFPGKPLAWLTGATGEAKTLLRRSWEAARRVPDIAEIVIATDDPSITDHAASFGAITAMTSIDCRNGTERCAEAAARIAADVIVNWQGDAPLTPPEAITAMIAALAADAGVAVATPMVRCSTGMIATLLAEQRRGAVGGTTVVVDRVLDALYFSKRVLPFFADRPPYPPVLLHVGTYAYRREALVRYATQEPASLELTEGLEQLRFLDAGVKVRLVPVALPPGGLWEVNNPSDVPLVEAALAARGLA